ncbi:MAG: hypothetical protein AB7Q23_02190 [Hyphomonadaceae bacterium]
MLGLFLSQVILLLAAAVIGFAAGWWLFDQMRAARRRAAQADVDHLREALANAQVRRARMS